MPQGFPVGEQSDRPRMTHETQVQPSYVQPSYVRLLQHGRAAANSDRHPRLEAAYAIAACSTAGNSASTKPCQQRKQLTAQDARQSQGTACATVCVCVCWSVCACIANDLNMAPES